jgi:hypothetical protein
MRGDVWVVFAGLEGGGAVGIVPQGLKPHFDLAVYGTAKAVPFHKTTRANALTRGEASNRSAGSATQNPQSKVLTGNRQTRSSTKTVAQNSHRKSQPKSTLRSQSKNLRVDKHLSQSPGQNTEKPREGLSADESGG